MHITPNSDHATHLSILPADIDAPAGADLKAIVKEAAKALAEAHFLPPETASQRTSRLANTPDVMAANGRMLTDDLVDQVLCQHLLAVARRFAESQGLRYTKPLRVKAINFLYWFVRTRYHQTGRGPLTVSDTDPLRLVDRPRSAERDRRCTVRPEMPTTDKPVFELRIKLPVSAHKGHVVNVHKSRLPLGLHGAFQLPTGYWINISNGDRFPCLSRLGTPLFEMMRAEKGVMALRFNVLDRTAEAEVIREDGSRMAFASTAHDPILPSWMSPSAAKKRPEELQRQKEVIVCWVLDVMTKHNLAAKDAARFAGDNQVTWSIFLRRGTRTTFSARQIESLAKQTNETIPCEVLSALSHAPTTHSDLATDLPPDFRIPQGSADVEIGAMLDLSCTLKHTRGPSRDKSDRNVALLKAIYGIDCDHRITKRRAAYDLGITSIAVDKLELTHLLRLRRWASHFETPSLEAAIALLSNGDNAGAASLLGTVDPESAVRFWNTVHPDRPAGVSARH